MAVLINLIASGLASTLSTVPPETPSRNGATIGGYSGYFALPSASAVPEGTLQFGYATGPSVARQDRLGIVPKNADNYSAILGFLPNLELGISFLASSPLNGMLDDRAVAVKYAPIRQRQFGFNLAFGSTDVHGTSRRTTEYVVAGRNFGRFTLEAGYLRGRMRGMMGAARLRLTPALDIIAEQGDGDFRGGATLSQGRFTFSAGYGSDEAPIAGISYRVPLDAHLRRDLPIATGPLDESGLAGAIAKLGGGSAEVAITRSKLHIRYEDVEGRDPVGTLSAVLQTAARMEGTFGRIRVTVRRLGIDLVTLEASAPNLRAFMNGETTKDSAFHDTLEVVDGSLGEMPSQTTKAGRMPSAIVSVRPLVKYRLGLKDELPNAESLETRALIPLPGQLTAAIVASPVVHQQYMDLPTMASPSLGLYQTRLVTAGLWLTAGVERVPDQPWSAGLQVTYLPKNPLRLTGRYATPIQNRPDVEAAYSLEAGIEDPRGSYYAFARAERFRLGEDGKTLGLTRRFGQTWVTIQNLWTRSPSEEIERVGVNFQLPLPGVRTRVANVAVTTAPVTDFSYMPRNVPRAVSGYGEPRATVFAPDQELTFRAQLTARSIMQNLERLRNP